MTEDWDYVTGHPRECAHCTRRREIRKIQAAKARLVLLGIFIGWIFAYAYYAGPAR